MEDFMNGLLYLFRITSLFGCIVVISFSKFDSLLSFKFFVFMFNRTWRLDFALFSCSLLQVNLSEQLFDFRTVGDKVNKNDGSGDVDPLFGGPNGKFSSNSARQI